MIKSLSSMKLDNYKPLRDLVFEALREAIITGELKSGERLMEVQLAEEMGVSRTPVREAIRKLELEGLVAMVPRKGAYVSGMSLKDAIDVFEIRESLEGLAAGLAAERITEEELINLKKVFDDMGSAVVRNDLKTLIKKDAEFHQIMFTASRNERLAQTINTLREHIERFRAQSFSNPARVSTFLTEHKKIYDALISRNAEKSEALARDHIRRSENNVVNILRKREAGKGVNS